MPYLPEHKANSHEKILKSAADLFCRYGFDTVSLSDVMKAANMTHGGFYAHFKSKTALYAEALRYAAKHSLLNMVSEEAMSISALKSLIDSYLSLAHIRQETMPCVLAFLSSDIAHREQIVRESYEDIFHRMVKKIARAFVSPITEEQAQEYAQYLVASMVGTVSIARSLVDTNLQQELLINSKVTLLNWLDSMLQKKS
ncbi:TetR/AcrR family transcriptional regulator [Vibrio sp. C8]